MELQFFKNKRKEVYKMFEGHCAYCGNKITFEEYQIDHIIPKKIFKKIEGNGGNFKDNLLPACSICNKYKGHLNLEEFREWLLNLHKINTDKNKKVKKLKRIAKKYGIEENKPFNGEFYFEKVKQHTNRKINDCF